VEASNAFLKVLEEPPPDSLIILISAKPELLFKTIISRCRILRFYGLSRNNLEEILRKDYGVKEDDLAHFLAYFCEGSLGKALSLKDIDILVQKNKIIDAFAVKKRFLPESLAIQNRDSLRDCLNILASWFRDIYLMKAGLPHRELINLDRRDDILRFMGGVSFAQLDKILDCISETLLYIEQNINIRLLLSNLSWLIKC
jgi:DNA polymerase-3 subunit delta'